MTHVPRSAVRVPAAAALALFLTAGFLSGQNASDGKPLVPDADYPKVLDQQVKVLQETMKLLGEAKDMTEKKKWGEKARCAAVLIAAAAQDNLKGPDAAQRAAVRDGALNVAALVKADKAAEAAKLADGLKTVKGDGKAKTERVKLFEAHIDIQELMSQYKLAKAGGQGTESALLKLATDKKKVVQPGAITDHLLATAYVTALTGELTGEYKPAKNAKDWQALAADMRKGGLEFAETLKAKDGKGAFNALNKMNTSCSVCHEKFRK